MDSTPSPRTMEWQAAIAQTNTAVSHNIKEDFTARKAFCTRFPWECKDQHLHGIFAETFTGRSTSTTTAKRRTKEITAKEMDVLRYGSPPRVATERFLQRSTFCEWNSNSPLFPFHTTCAILDNIHAISRDDPNHGTFFHFWSEKITCDLLLQKRFSISLEIFYFLI